MLGVYRFVLAIFVVQAHAWNEGSGPLSYHAVFSFYVLSGFLMTRILNESYGFGSMSFARFWINRALRLYPAYLLVVAVTLTHIVMIAPLDRLTDAMRTPRDAYAAVVNLTMVGLAGLDVSHIPQIRLVPNAWSLSVELFCYLLLSLLFARSLRWAMVMLLVGVAVTSGELVRVAMEAPPNFGFQNHYGVLQAGLIPFASGSLAYFLRHSGALAFSHARLSVLGLLWVGNCILAHAVPFHRFVSGLYVVVAINVVLVPMLSRHDDAHPRSGVVRALGGLSYPMFVSHMLVASLILEGPWFDRLSFAFFVTTLVATLGVSTAIHFGVERRLEPYRARIKSGADRPWGAWSDGPAARDVGR